MITRLKLLTSFFIVFFIFLSCTRVFADSASLFFTKPATNIVVGDTFSISLKIKSPSEPINAISGVIKFSEDNLKIVSVSRNNSIINIWTSDQYTQKNKIEFEGVILDPGYIGEDGNIVSMTFVAQKPGPTTIELLEGSVLANDGLGTNILSSLKSVNLNIDNPNSVPVDQVEMELDSQNVLLPKIIKYPKSVSSGENILIIGKGEPNALTKLSFRDDSVKSFGERFVSLLQFRKEKPNDVIVKNTTKGNFVYTSSSNLIAGVYSIIPSLIDHNQKIEETGSGVSLFVNDSKIVHYIIIIINILVLLVPVVVLIMIIYFIPWYSLLRMRVLRRKLSLEEEKIELSEQELKENIPKCIDNKNDIKTL